MKPGTAFFLILVFSLCRFGSSTAFASEFAVEADRYLKGLVQSNQFSGAVLVAQNGKPLLSKGYNFANREHDIPNTPQTRFRLGSITKQFTAMCIMILQKEGTLSVQDPVSKFVEESPEAWKPITIHHLLTHTSGIPGFTEFPDNLQFERLPTTVEATVKRFKDKPLMGVLFLRILRIPRFEISDLVRTRRLSTAECANYADDRLDRDAANARFAFISAYSAYSAVCSSHAWDWAFPQAVNPLDAGPVSGRVAF